LLPGGQCVGAGIAAVSSSHLGSNSISCCCCRAFVVVVVIVVVIVVLVLEFVVVVVAVFCSSNCCCWQADYVLVLVSPLYHRVIAGQTRPEDGSDSVLHARHIHDRMYAEQCRNKHTSSTATRRFVPVIMSGNGLTSGTLTHMTLSTETCMWKTK